MCPMHGAPLATVRRSPVCRSQQLRLASVASPCPLRQSPFTGVQLRCSPDVGPACRGRRQLTVAMASKGMYHVPPGLQGSGALHAPPAETLSADCYLATKDRRLLLQQIRRAS